MCKKIGSRYQEELFTNNQKIMMQKWESTLEDLNIGGIPHLLDEICNLMANQKADLIYKSIGEYLVAAANRVVIQLKN